jgi:hypothetical protein
MPFQPGQLIYVCIALLLNACVGSVTNTINVNPRPEEWAPAEKMSLSAICPDLSGVYEDWAEDCGASHCQLLNDLLFRTDYPVANSVEIRVLSDGSLKITGKWHGAETEIVLSRRHRDFECVPEGLIVTGGDGSFFAGWTSGRLVNETRTFNRCSDGSLVMQVERTSQGNFYPLHLYHTHEIVWARWKAASPDD